MSLLSRFRPKPEPEPVCECGKTEHTVNVTYDGKRLRYTLPALRAHDVIEQFEHNPYPYPFDGIMFMDSLDVLHTLHPELLKSWMIDA